MPHTPCPHREGGPAGDSKAAFAATGHAEMADHFIADVPGAMHNNASGEGVVIARIQSLEPNRMSMGSDKGTPVL
jgi:hypothetical protein